MTKDLDKGVVLSFATRALPRAQRPRGTTEDTVLTVLVISDVPTDRSAIRSALEAEGFILQEAADGHSGLKLVTAMLPDCILLDGALPDFDGTEMIEALRGDDGRLPCAIMMLTTDSSLAGAAIRAGAQDYIVKDRFDHDGLSLAIRMATRQFQLLEQQRQADLRNAQLAAIVMASSDAILNVGLNSIVQSWNPGAETMFGYSEAEAIGRSVDDLIVPAERRAERDQMHGVAREGGHAILKDTLRCHKSGAMVPVEVKSSPIIDPSGAVTGISVIMRDISERKRAEQQRQRLDQLIAHSTEFIALADPKGRLTFLNRAGRQMIGVDCEGAADSDGSHATDFVAPTCREKLRTIILPTARRDGAWAGELQLVNQQTGALVDVACSIFAQRNEQGDLAGFAAVMRDVTQDRVTADSIRASEAFRRSVFEASPDCLKILSLDGHLEEMNANGQCLMEVDDFETLRGRSWSSLWPEAAVKDVERAVAEANGNSGVAHFTALCPTAKGTPKYWDVIVKPIPGKDGQPNHLIAASRDITERKQVEAALRLARDSLRHLVDHSPFGIYAVDADFRLVQVSEGARKVFANVRPLLGRDFAEVLRFIWPGPFANEVIRRFRHTLETGDPYSAPSTVERRQDISEVEAYDWTIERVVLPDGRNGVVCHFYDLSDRQRLEAALRESQQRSQLALDTAQLGWWQYDPLNRVAMWDQRFKQIFGVSKDQDDFDAIMEIVGCSTFQVGSLRSNLPAIM